ncbi:polycystin-1-like protein 3 [Lampetra fluviatilis]
MGARGGLVPTQLSLLLLPPLLLLLLMAVSTAACPAPQFPAGSSCFLPVTAPPLSFWGAQRECERAGGLLATLPDAVTRAATKERLVGEAERSWWIGLLARDDDDGPAGPPRWLDGANVTEPDWAPGEPAGRCGLLSAEAAFRWAASDRCEQERPFLCQIDPRQALACAGTNATLRCGSARVVTVEVATFGRGNAHFCRLNASSPDGLGPGASAEPDTPGGQTGPDGHTQEDGCSTVNVTDLVAGLCRGVQVCQAGADPALLGDPCPSRGSYLTLSYSCVEALRVTVGEVFAVGDTVPIAIEWLLPEALGANLSCSVSLGDGRLIEASRLSGLLSEVSHRYSLPGTFTLQVECAAAEWHVTARRSLAVQQPISGFSPAPCLKRPQQWQVEAECVVRFGHDFPLPVSLLAGTNVSFQLVARDTVLASWTAADGAETQNATLTAAMQERVGEGEHVLRVLATNNVTAGGAPVQAPLLLALRRPVGDLHATVTTPLVEVGQEMQVEVRVEAGTPERVLFELLGVKGLVSEEREAANASHAIYRIPVSQQDVFSVRVTVSDRFANVSALAGNVTSVWGVAELSLDATLTVTAPPGRAVFRATARDRDHLPPDVRYSANFGDGRAGSSQLRDLQIRHVYRQPGTYLAQFNLSNQVSTESLEVRVHVEPGEGADCGMVGVAIAGGAAARADALPHALWRPLTLRAIVTANCSRTASLRLLRYKWRLVSMETNDAIRFPISVETHHPELTVPGRTLAPGLHRVVFTAWMGGGGGNVEEEEEEDDRWEGGDGSEPPDSAPDFGRAEAFVSLRPGSLVAAIVGGAGRTVSSGRPVLLDASASHDPDLGPTAIEGLAVPTRNPQAVAAPTALNFSWACDACEPSCLEAISLSRPVLELPSGCLVAGSEVTVKVTVSAPSKPSAEAEQMLMVVTGTVPRVEIGCISNCGAKVIPGQRLALHCTCHDCQGPVSYNWSLRQREEQDAALVERDVDWAAVSTTGREQPYLVFTPGALSNHTGNGIIRVTVSNQGAVALAEFAVVVVPPPRRGRCSVSPDAGWALSTRFSVLCSEFSSPEPPLVYCFTAEDGHASSLLQCGAEPMMEAVLLPAGDPAHGGRLLLRVSVTDALGAALSQLVSVTVGVAPAEGGVGLDVGDPLALVHTENVGALAQLTNAVASVLNQPSSQEEGETPPQNAKLREKMIVALGEMPVRGVQGAQQLSEALSQITARPNELSHRARLRASATLSTLSASLQGAAVRDGEEREREQGAAGMEQGARCLVAVASNILQVTGETAHGRGEDRDAGQVSRQALEALDTLQGVLLSKRVPGEGTMLVSTPALTLAMDRRSGDSMSGFAIGGSQSSEAAFTLPSTLPLPSAEPVDIQMVSFVSNPFAWSAEGAEVSGPVSSLSLLSAVDRAPIPVHNLSQPIEIMLPQAAPSEPSRALVPGDGRLTLLQVNVTRDDLTLVVTVETGGQAMRLALFLSQGEEPTERRHNLSVSVDTRGTEYTWLVEPEELPGAGTYYVGVQAEHVQAEHVQAEHGADGTGNASFWVGTFATRCLYWHETQRRWAGDGCRVGPLTTATLTHCLCSHLTSFGAGFLVMPNVVDVSRTAELFATVSENPVVVSVVAAVLLLYLPIVVWARRKDRQDLAKVKVTVLADNDPQARQRYLVTVYTGHRRGACTTAKVTLTLYGADAESEPHLLADERKPLLERGGVDSFLLTTLAPLGELQAVRLWHDNSGKDPSWYVSRVVVQDLEQEERFHFLCDAWLALDVGEGSLDRVFPAASTTDLKQFRNLFYQKTTRDFRDGHLWFSVLSRPPRSPFTCVQRVSCCLSLLLCTMLTSIMFWGVPTGPPNAKLDLGGIEITWTEVMIGIESSILMFPINLLIVQFFRNVRPKPNRLSPRQPARSALPAKPEPPINKPASVQELRRLARRVLRALWPRDAPRVAAAVADESDACRLTGLEMRTLAAPERRVAPLGRGRGARERRGEERGGPPCGADGEVSRLLALVSDAARAPASANGDFYGPERRHLDSVCLALEKLPPPGEGAGADSAELCVHLQRVLHGLDAGRYGDVMREVDVLAGQLGRYDNALREVDVLPGRFYYRGDAMREVDVLPGRPGPTAPSAASGTSMLPHAGTPPRRGGLPWWCVYVGWALVVATSGVSAFFTMLYGLQYGRKRSLEWLLTTSISIFQSIFITQPLKVLGFAVFFALVLKKGDEVEDGEEQIEDAIADQRSRALEPGAQKTERSRVVYTPPSSTRMEQLKRQHEKEQRMYGLLREILVYMCFLWMLLLVAYGQRDPHAYHLNRALSASLVGELGKGPVSLRDVFSWANATLLPSLFAEHPGFLVGGTARLVGAVRLRQLRVAPGRCRVAPPLSSVSPPCRALYSWEDEDTQHYHGAQWAKQPQLNATGDDAGELLAGVWRYRSQAKSRSFPLWGRLAFYRGGGYVAELGTDRGHAQRLLQLLFDSSWLDTRTRAVLLELTVYNANVNLFTTAAVVMETNGLGGFLPWVELHSLRLYQYTGSLHIFVMMAEIIYYLFIIYYMVVQVKTVRRLGWRYLRCRWSLLEVAIIVLSWAGLALFTKRLLLGQRDVALHLKNPNRFVSFYETALADSALGYVLALLVLLGTVKLWRLLRLNPKMCLLTGALARAGRDMASFLTVLLVVLGAYALSCHVMFGRCLENYKSVWDSLQTLVSLQLGAFNYREVMEVSPVLGPLLIGSCIIFMSFTLLNLFISVILVAFAEEQQLHEASEEEEIVSLLLAKIYSFCGIRKPASAAA